jgi:dipeptidyl aminopeptidase/acylaminoacyl peptidase
MRRCRLLVAVVAILVALGACGGSGDDGASSATTLATTTTLAPTTTTSLSVVDARPFEVTRREVVVEDTTRPTMAAPDRGLPEKPSRTLPLLVLAPDGPGPFPVLEFSHGVTGTGPAYELFITPVAAAGYIVVLPTFPLSSGPDGEIFDYVNQPGDVYFALDSVIAMGDDPSDPLYGRVDGSRLAVSGHSLGAMTTIGAAYNSCCAQPRVGAAIELAGIEAPFSGDFTNRPPTPLLLVHGESDSTINVSGSEDLYAKATGPAAFVRFPGLGHSDILRNDAGVLTADAMIAWLDRWLLDSPTGLDALPDAVESSGIATLVDNDL